MKEAGKGEVRDMNPLDLLDAVGGVEEEMIQEAGREVPAAKRIMRRIRPWLAGTACAVILLGGIVLSGKENGRVTPEEMANEQTETTAPGGTLAGQEPSATQVYAREDRERIAVFTVYLSPAAQSIEEKLLKMHQEQRYSGFRNGIGIGTSVLYENRLLIFNSVANEYFDPYEWGPDGTLTQTPSQALLAVSEQLKDYLGEPLWDSYYRVKGMDELKYVIQLSEGGIYSLWSFQQMTNLGLPEGTAYDPQTWLMLQVVPDPDCRPLTYGEVWKIIYGVNGAEDIDAILSDPPTANMTALGQEIQAKIGSHCYTDRGAIAAFYAAVSPVVYVRDDQNRGPGIRFSYSFSTDEQNKLASGESIWGGRYLTIRLKSGTSIENVKYDALSGVLYGWGIGQSEPLSEEQVMTLNRILGIE